MRISIVCLTINLILGSFMIPAFQQAGMGIANTLSAIANTALLGYALRKALPKLEFAALLPNAAAVTGATLLACLTAWGTNTLWESHYGHKVLWARAGAVFVPMILATLVYGLAALFLKLPQFSELRSLITRRRRPASKSAAPAAPAAPKSNSDSTSDE
jgi:peptidoglycan biosynthesis protein MviN/MurJ (putative lipid II flippase)